MPTRRSIVALAALTVVVAACGSPTGNTTRGSNTTAAGATGGDATPTTQNTIYEPLACRTYTASVTTGTVTDADLTELSGFAAGVANPDVLWTHNDSGDSARIFAITAAGKKLATVEMRDSTVFDVEDIAIQKSSKEIWVADIGDNFGFRSTVQLYHFPEPEVVQSDAPTETVVDAKTLDVKYQRPGESGTYSIDAESLFLDNDGNGYIVEKPRDRKLAWVFRIDATDMQKGSATAQPVVQITGNSNGSGVGPTAADFSADGTTLAIKNYSETFVWRFSARSSVVAALKAKPTAPCVVKAGVGEAITFVGSNLYTVEEGTGKPIRRTNAR